MRTLETVAVLIVAGVLAFVGVEARRASDDRRVRAEQAARLADAQAAREEEERAEEAARAAVKTTAAVQLPPARDVAAIRQRLDVSAAGTYLREMLPDVDSVLMRWPETGLGEVRVWVQPTSDTPDWNPAFVPMARAVFPEWSQAGFPLNFSFVLDSTRADIAIRWQEKFPESDGQRVGVTERAADSAGWIRHADVTVATHDSAGRALSPQLVQAVARHEVGHALGLGHSPDSATVMYPKSTTLRITPADRTTMHLLYMLPPGSLKGP